MKKIFLLVGIFFLMSCASGNSVQEQVSHKFLISAQELNEKLQNGTENLVIIDVRPDMKFILEHIPGARQVWRPDIQLSEDEVGYDGMRTTPEGLAKLFGSLGIDNNTEIIIYGSDGNLDASRLFWLSEMYGHTNQKMLNGGWDAWKNNGFKVERVSMNENFTAKTYQVNPTHYPQLNISFEDVKDVVVSENPEYMILDTRSEAEYNGTQLKKGAFLKGKIPNSVWIEWSEFLDKSGNYLPIDQMQELLDSRGITPDKKIIVYCQSGVRSAHTWFILKHLFGFPNVYNYDGSWIEWSMFAQNGNAPI